MDITVPAGRKIAYLSWYMQYWALANPSYCGSHNCDIYLNVSVTGGSATYNYSATVNASTASTLFGAGTYTEDPAGDFYDYGAKYFKVPIAVPSSGTTLTLNFSLDCNECGYSALVEHGISVYGSVFGDFTLQLTAAPEGFRPRDDGEVDPAISGCDGATLDDCEPMFAAAFVNGGPTDLAYVYPPIAKIKFILENVSNLTGNSTNNGSSADPDFTIDAQGDGFDEPASNHMSVQTSEEVNSATVTITSHDYGGTARLTAKAIFPGSPDVETHRVVLEIGPVNDSNNTVWVPGCVQNPPAYQFAQLPRDADCNGMADKWEDDHSTVNGNHLAANWDDKPGFNSNSPAGDGFAVHDEYRGFHYVEDDGTTEKWTWTDPKDKQDVFFWDAVGNASCSMLSLSANCVTDALKATSANILASQTTFISYKRVNPTQANAQNVLVPSSGVSYISRNTQQATVAYALVFIDGTNLGTGVIGDSGTFVNDGTPIKLGISNMHNASTALGFPEDVLLAQTIAHETGHKFDICHPKRQASHVAQPSDLQTLTLQDYSRSTRNNQIFYARLRRYDYNGNDIMGESIKTDDNLAGNSITGWVPVSAGTCTSSSNDCVYEVTTGSALASSPNTINLATQLGLVMDWTPKLTLQALSNWQFDTSSYHGLEGIYVKYHTSGGQVCTY